MRNGFFRLWVVASVLWLVGWGAKVGYDRWWNPACFRIITVAISSDTKTDDRTLAQGIQTEIPSKIYCGDKTDSSLLTLERLATRQVVTQVATEYLISSGWSAEAIGSLDIFGKFGTETVPISAAAIKDSTHKLVQESRLNELYPLLPIIIGTPIFLLFVGIATAWVADGFGQKKRLS